MTLSIEEPIKVDTMVGVREYAEGYPVELRLYESSGRLVARAINEGGNNVTDIDLADLVAWLRNNHPQLLLG